MITRLPDSPGEPDRGSANSTAWIARAVPRSPPIAIEQGADAVPTQLDEARVERGHREDHRQIARDVGEGALRTGDEELAPRDHVGGVEGQPVHVHPVPAAAGRIGRFEDLDLLRPGSEQRQAEDRQRAAVREHDRSLAGERDGGHLLEEAQPPFGGTLAPVELFDRRQRVPVDSAREPVPLAALDGTAERPRFGVVAQRRTRVEETIERNCGRCEHARHSARNDDPLGRGAVDSGDRPVAAAAVLGKTTAAITGVEASIATVRHPVDSRVRCSTRASPQRHGAGGALRVQFSERIA